MAHRVFAQPLVNSVVTAANVTTLQYVVVSACSVNTNHGTETLNSLRQPVLRLLLTILTLLSIVNVHVV